MKEFNKNGSGPEPEVRVSMTKTLRDVSSTDYYFKAIDLLRTRFIPGHDSWQFIHDSQDSLSWLRIPENTATFEKINEHKDNIKFLPEFMKSSQQTLSLFLELGRETNKYKDSPIYNQSVAFPVLSREFATDLHSSVFNLFSKMKNYNLEKGDFKLERKNNTKILGKISKFYETYGYAYKEEAADAVTVILFKRYWETLKESAKILAAPEMRLVYKTTRFPGAAINVHGITRTSVPTRAHS